VNEDDIVDVEYTENKIKGKPLYYTTSQVANILGDTSDSAVRFYCTKFKSILNLDMAGTHRKFKQEDIDKLKYIKKLLKEDGFSVSQVQEYASEDLNEIENKVANKDPLALQSLATALSLEMGIQLEDFKLAMAKELENHKNELNDMIATTVDDIVTEKMDVRLNEFKSYMDEKELSAKTRDLEMIDLMRSNMEKRKSENDNKGFWSKLLELFLHK